MNRPLYDDGWILRTRPPQRRPRAYRPRFGAIYGGFALLLAAVLYVAVHG